jgi:hypothetical protein
MSDPNSDFQAPPPPPAPKVDAVGPRPTNLRPFAIGFFVLGLILLGAGIAKILPGGPGPGIAFVFWGILLFAFSFIRLPQPIAADEPPMSGLQKVIGIFFEPSRVFRNLRAHPRWLAALLVIGLFNIAYSVAFVQRLTPERIVNFKYEKMEQSPIKPPADRMEQAKDAEMQASKHPIQRIVTAATNFVGVFVFAALVGTLCFVGVLAFGGRMNFWQAFAAVLFSSVPVVVITKAVSLIILFLKSPDDIHPILGAETLVQDNLGILFAPAEHPTLFSLSAAIGVLSFYGLWLRAKGLTNAGTKVSSSAGWGVAITLWVLAVIVGMIFATLFSSFIS